MRGSVWGTRLVCSVQDNTRSAYFVQSASCTHTHCVCVITPTYRLNQGGEVPLHHTPLVKLYAHVSGSPPPGSFCFEVPPPPGSFLSKNDQTTKNKIKMHYFCQNRGLQAPAAFPRTSRMSKNRPPPPPQPAEPGGGPHN